MTKYWQRDVCSLKIMSWKMLTLFCWTTIKRPWRQRKTENPAASYVPLRSRSPTPDTEQSRAEMSQLTQTLTNMVLKASQTTLRSRPRLASESAQSASTDCRCCRERIQLKQPLQTVFLCCSNELCRLKDAGISLRIRVTLVSELYWVWLSVKQLYLIEYSFQYPQTDQPPVTHH